MCNISVFFFCFSDTKVKWSLWLPYDIYGGLPSYNMSVPLYIFYTANQPKEFSKILKNPDSTFLAYVFVSQASLWHFEVLDSHICIPNTSMAYVPQVKYSQVSSYVVYEFPVHSRNLLLHLGQFGSIELLRNQFLKTDGSSNGGVFFSSF
jgi:hypothetical protein